MERAAKQEAQVLARINELRRQGLWSASKLPLCVEPARNKTHWDFLLEEVRWMHMDFQQERRFKRILARKVSHDLFSRSNHCIFASFSWRRRLRDRPVNVKWTLSDRNNARFARLVASRR